MRRRALVAALVLGLASAAGAAVRARLGGTLNIGLVGVAAPGPGSTADTPEAASARALLALPLCRLVPQPTPVLASVLRTGTGAQDELRIEPLAGARFPDGSPLTARDIALTLVRLGGAGGGELALLAPVAGLQAALDAAVRQPEQGLRLPLGYPWPELETSLCHPAFAPTRAGEGNAPLSGVGLYRPGPEGRFAADRGAPRGPPFPGGLSFSALTRSSHRRLQRGELHVVLGEVGDGEVGLPMLFATYLVYRPASLPEGVVAALAGLDLGALVRTFVPGPAVPLRALLPPALMAAPPPPAPSKRGAGPPSGARGFTLAYDSGLPEQRAVAERLQVLLADAGHPVRLQGLDRMGLARARAGGAVEAVLASVLLTPVAAPALAEVLGLVGDPALLARELPPLGAITDPLARAARVRERATELLGTLPIVPLYARGLRTRLSPALVDARRDAFGLLVLDDAWLSD